MTARNFEIKETMLALPQKSDGYLPHRAKPHQLVWERGQVG